MIDQSHSAFKTVFSGILHHPHILEALQEGIDYLVGFVKNPFMPQRHKDVCVEWIEEATSLLAPPTQRTHVWPTYQEVADAIARDHEAELKHKNNGPIGPQICTKCKFKNDYAGKEHLSADGSYTCRSCK
jgi:hypothetical protein